MDNEAVERIVERIVVRTATTVSAALDRMVYSLPEDAAPQMAVELVVRDLTARQPRLMRLIMENPDIRDVYDVAIATTDVAADLARIRAVIARQRERDGPD